MSPRKIFPLFVLVLFILGCKYLQPAQKLESEAATENPNPTIQDLPLKLNMENVGNIASMLPRDKRMVDGGGSVLDRRIEEIVKAREANGVFVDGSTQVVNEIYIFLNPQLSVGAFGKVFEAIKTGGGSPRVPRKIPRKSSEIENSKPNPLYLEVNGGVPDRTMNVVYRSQGHSNDNVTVFLLPVDNNHDYSYDLEVEFAKSRDSLLSTRAFQDSIEISADEKLFANDKHTDDKGPRYTQVKQRPITTDALKSELERIKASGNPITIIVSDKVSYGKLLSIFEAVDAEFHVIVRQ